MRLERNLVCRDRPVFEMRRTYAGVIPFDRQSRLLLYSGQLRADIFCGSNDRGHSQDGNYRNCRRTE